MWPCKQWNGCFLLMSIKSSALVKRILCLWLPNRSRCSKQAGWRLLQGKRIIGVWWFSVITHSVVQTTLALFYRLLHVCSELSEETLPSAVLHGVYYLLCPGQLRTYITRKGHVLTFIKYLGRWGCETKWCWAVGCLYLYIGVSYRLTKQSFTEQGPVHTVTLLL